MADIFGDGTTEGQDTQPKQEQVVQDETVYPDNSAGLMEPTEEQQAAMDEFEAEGGAVVDVDLTDTETRTAAKDEGHRDTSGERMFLIEIDEVEGRPNFETVGVNGTIYKIKRGEPVKVPESVLEVLNHAVAERLVQRDLPGGGVETTRRKYSAVPFRMLRAL